MLGLKKLLLATYLLLTAICVQSQVLWEKTWGGPYDDGCEVRNTRDGGMIAIGSYGLDSWLMRLTANGDTIWTYRVRVPLDLCAVTETWDGGFLATGVTRTPHRDVVAWKFGIHGDSLWTKIYVDSLHTEGNYTVIQRPDSSFIITGYTSAHGYDMLAMHIDSVGNLLWNRHYGTPGFEGGTMAAPTSDGGYILSTTGGTNFFSNIWVMKIDSLGDSLWSRNYVEPYQTGGSVPTVTSQGNILIMGWIQPGDYDNYLLCLDPQGNPLWTQDYPGIGFESRTARGIIEDRFGGYTFVSSVDVGYGPAGNDHDIALFRLDSLGNVTRIHRIGHLGDEMPRYFEQTANGDYLFFGYSTSFIPIGQQTYLARLHPGPCGEYFYDLDAPLRVLVCPSDTFALDAGIGNSNILWNDGDTNQIRSVAVSDTFFVQVTDSQGCVAHSNAVIVTLCTGPQFTWNSSGNLTVQFQGMPGDGTQWQWDFGDGASDTAQNPVHMYAQPGTYYVCFQSLVPNCGLESNCDSVMVASVQGTVPFQPMPILVYPNPSNGHFELLNPNPSVMKMEVLNMDGKILQVGHVEANARGELDLRDFAQGIYILRGGVDGSAVFHERLVIAR